MDTVIIDILTDAHPHFTGTITSTIITTTTNPTPPPFNSVITPRSPTKAEGNLRTESSCPCLVNWTSTKRFGIHLEHLQTGCRTFSAQFPEPPNRHRRRQWPHQNLTNSIRVLRLMKMAAWRCMPGPESVSSSEIVIHCKDWLDIGQDPLWIESCAVHPVNSTGTAVVVD